MASTIDELIAEMKANPVNVRFADACKVADHFFGEATQNATSHRVWKMPWPGNPRVNMQDDKGKAKAYQVRQLLEAVERRLNQLRVTAQTPAPGQAATGRRETHHGKRKRKRTRTRR